MCKMSPASTLIVNRTYGNYEYNFDENKLNYYIFSYKNDNFSKIRDVCSFWPSTIVAQT